MIEDGGLAEMVNSSQLIKKKKKEEGSGVKYSFLTGRLGIFTDHVYKLVFISASVYP